MKAIDEHCSNKGWGKAECADDRLYLKDIDGTAKLAGNKLEFHEHLGEARGIKENNGEIIKDNIQKLSDKLLMLC